MLINLSNHPSNTWQENQISTARTQYGEIVDIAFPLIPPEEGLGYIHNIANEYLEKIEEKIKKTSDYEIAVHIMGELTFTYVLVNKLREKGIKAIASTTRRDVVETAEGKLSRFSFVRFREYF
ncbi:MAG: hypothetical protein WHS65_05310 [Melioribacteraceae bacterium]